MATKSLEQKVKRLEDKIEKLEYESERHRAAIECTRLLNRFCYLNNQHVQKEHPPIASMFALKAPDVRVQLGQLGVFEGAEAVNRIYGQKSMPMGEGAERPSRVGMMYLHPLASEYIEVARDLKTAKGVCLSIGIESGINRETGELTPAWGWGSYGVDFLKEDDEWKIWHFHIYRIFRAPYKESWTAFDPDDEPVMPMSDAMKPTRPGKDDYPYRANEEFIFKPDPPEPYETFDEATGY